MDWNLVILVGIGFAAGFINTLAGGGSLFSLPFLMYLGLPANIANGTLRIAIILQNIVGVSSFKKQKVFKFKDGIWLAIPAMLGSIIGAFIAVELNEAIMEMIIACLLILMFVLLIFKPSAWVKGQSGKVKTKPGIVQIIIFFFIGVYGGFIQAGVGFFLLAGLVLGAGFDLVKANAIKIFIVLLYTIFALCIFIYNDQIDFKLGLILAVGNMFGAFVGSKFAVSWGPGFVRYVLLIVLLGTGLEMLGVFNWLFAFFK